MFHLFGHSPCGFTLTQEMKDASRRRKLSYHEHRRDVLPQLLRKGLDVHS